MKILVVDDEKDLAGMIKSAVELKYKTEVLMAQNGHDGLEVIRKEKPNYVISDIMMPDMDGLEMIRSLREEENNTPVIFVSAFVNIENTMEAIRLGAADFIRKPFKIHELYHSLDRLIELDKPQEQFTQSLSALGKMNWEFATKDFNVQLFASQLAQFVTKSRTIPIHEKNSFYVVVSEALLNAREHGNLEMRSHVKDEDMAEYERLMSERLRNPVMANRKIHITFEHANRDIKITISDEGSGFDHRLIDSEEFYSHDNLMKQHGKGLLIVKNYMDSVIFNDKGNTITLIKSIKKASKNLLKKTLNIQNKRV